MNKKIYVLGLGGTINQYKHNSKNITFGVNDIYKHIPVKHLVCVDAESSFEQARRSIILNSTPEKFYTVFYHTNEWYAHKPIILEHKCCYTDRTILRPNISIGDPFLYSGLSSPFMAVQLAYKLHPEMTDLYIYGVDYSTHRNFTGRRLDRELSFWKWLLSQLTSKGIKIHIPKESRLTEVL